MILIVLDQMLYNNRSRSLAERTPDEDIVGDVDMKSLVHERMHRSEQVEEEN